MRETWSLIALTSGSRLYWLLVSLGTTVITARALGPDGRGVYVAAVGWVALFATIGNLSLSQVIIYIASSKTKKHWLEPVLGSALVIVAVVAAIEWTIAATMYGVTGGRVFHHLDAVTLSIAFLALPILLWAENGNSILVALGHLPVVNVSQMVGATAALALTFLAVAVLRFGVRGAILSMAIAQGLTAGWALSAILRQAGKPRVDRAVTGELLSGGFKLHLNAVGTYLFTQANVLILNHYRAPEETAYFQLAVQLLSAIQIIPTAVSAVSYSLVSRKGPDDAWPEQRRLLLQTTGVIALIAGVAYLLAPVGVRMVFGREFLPAVPLFRILLLSVVGMTFSQVMASQWIGRGLFLQSAILTLIIGWIAVAANYLAVAAHGARGAAWVMAGTYGLTLLASLIMAGWVEVRSRRRR